MDQLRIRHGMHAAVNRVRQYTKKVTGGKREKKIALILAVIIAGAVTTVAVQKRSIEVDAKMQKTQQELAREVLRFHILANSDSEEDQELKMQVKEEVLKFMKSELPSSHSVDETKEWASSHLKEIEELAEAMIVKKGYDYPVHAEVTDCEFPDKTYGDVTFPAGEYEALRIEIGKAQGHNWWCVLYPNLCFVDATNAVVPEEGKEELQEVLTDDEYHMITATSKVKIKWFFGGNE